MASNHLKPQAMCFTLFHLDNKTPSKSTIRLQLLSMPTVNLAAVVGVCYSCSCHPSSFHRLSSHSPLASTRRHERRNRAYQMKRAKYSSTYRVISPNQARL
jgi:hypothetical protein